MPGGQLSSLLYPRAGPASVSGLIIQKTGIFYNMPVFFPFSVIPGHFIMTDGSQRLMPGTKVISSSEMIMQR